jgi:hypothetical protein
MWIWVIPSPQIYREIKRWVIPSPQIYREIKSGNPSECLREIQIAFCNFPCRIA